MSDVTRLVEAAREGNRQAAADVIPLRCDELRTLGPSPEAADQPWASRPPSGSEGRGSRAAGV